MQKDTRQDFLDWVRARNPGEDAFCQAVEDFAASVLPFIADHPHYGGFRLMERLSEPDRLIAFRVTWADDRGEVQVNRGYRVQFSNAIGPYKGGLRFHPSVDASVLKSLAFEQVFKNALTGLPMGGAKGGADFDPKGRSEAEIMRFCQAFMSELFRHIGPDRDVPAGDIGVSEREIGYMFGQYKRIVGAFEGALTGKGLEYGGSCMRPEATGYGAVYFLDAMLKEAGQGVEGCRALVSGAGNVALHAAEKLIHRGAKPVTLSDSKGVLHVPGGLTEKQIAGIREMKQQRGARLAEVADDCGGTWHEGEKPWGLEAELAMPCATENELDGDDAGTLVGTGVRAVCEGANLPCTAEAVAAFREGGVLYGPGKAANAGGVAMSGLEMSQNSARLSRTPGDLRQALKRIMNDIHGACVEHGRDEDGIDYVRGANIAGFRKVADAMLAFGVV